MVRIRRIDVYPSDDALPSDPERLSAATAQPPLIVRAVYDTLGSTVTSTESSSRPPPTNSVPLVGVASM